jgi:transposase
MAAGFTAAGHILYKPDRAEVSPRPTSCNNNIIIIHRMKATHSLGIDISKDKFDVSLRPLDTTSPIPRHRAAFDNRPAGFKKLRRWLAQHLPTPARLHACLEATSRYGDALALDLYAQPHLVSVVNPRCVRHYADSRLVRTQHDALDAEIIADFCATQNPRPWQPAPAELRQLQDLTRLRQFFVHQSARLQNRLQTESPALARIVRTHMRQLQKTVAQLETQMAAHLQTHAALARQVERVDSIPGIGPVTAAAVVAELPPLERLEHAGQAVALAGLDPRKKDSGSSVRGVAHLSKMGSRPLRGALYMAGVSALTHNPLVRALGERLAAKGHRGKTVVCAAMRKLVRLIYGVLKHERPFDPK